MKKIVKIVTALLALIFTADSHAQNFTNRGREFWVGYGHHQYMETSCDGVNQGNNTQNMVLYLSAEQAAVVTVTLDSSNAGILPVWTRTYNIPANTVIQTENLPKGSTDAAASGSTPNYDARLFDLPPPLGGGGDRIWRRKGIHIVSNVPIVAYAHIYGGVSSGATMLLPIETWGYSYTSINSEQRDADRSFSWMYVVAKDDNTRVRITPTANSRTGRPNGVPFTVDLQKGWIFQFVGESDCQTGNGPELTGTKIKSIVGGDGICHQIAVFSGSSRTGGETLTCGTGSGRDNDIQQTFPEHVWGKRYLTTPFSKATSGTNLQANQFQTSVYKILLKEPGTTVKKNGVTLSITGNVFKYSSSTADYIEADKPVMVAQFMSGTSACNGAQGDPEMIFISPIEQAINNIGFYRNTREAIVANYLTLVVPTAGLSSLRIDNSQIFNHTYPHPQNPINGVNYTVVVKGWAATQDQCLVRCDSTFTAITYGLGGAESYGYNAGTFLKNLNAVSEIFNTPDTSGTAQPFTCTGTPMEITALVAYKPTSMNWRVSALGSVVSPNADVFVSNPVVIDSVIIGIAKYYRYKLPGTYIFNTAGSYDLPIVCTSTDVDNCSLQETLQIRIEVKARPSSAFTFTHSGCRTDSVQFSGPNNTGTLVANGWNWNFGDATVDSIKNPKKVYGSTGTYNVSLVVTSVEGCLSDTTRQNITISPARAASIFVAAPDTCQGATLTFSDSTTVTAGTFYWDFGTGTPRTLTSNTPQTITYTNPGIYIVKHVIFPTGNCVSDTVYRTITIYAKPVKPLVTRPVTYCQNGTAAPLAAVALAGNTLTYYSVFPLASGSASPITPSTTTAGIFNYYVIQTSPQGCVSDTAIIPVTIAPVIAGNTITADQTVCSGSPAATLTGSTPTGGTPPYNYQWQQSTDGGTTWTNITGANVINYPPGILSTGVTQFRRVVTSGLCTGNSNVVSITVQTNLSNFNITASQTICEGTAPALLDGQTPTGGTGTYVFQWQTSPDAVNWTVITGAGATLEDYQPPVLLVRTYYRRITTGGNCPAISNVVTININPTANGNISGPAAICQYNTAAVSFTATTGTAPFNIVLLITAPGGGTTTVNQTISNNGPQSINVIPINSAPGTYTIALQSVSDNGRCVRITGLNTVTINVTATPVLLFSFMPAPPPICQGNSIGIVANGATSYTWSPATGLNTTAGTSVIANPNITTTYTVTGTTNACNGTGTVTVTVNPIPAKPAVVRPVIYCQNAVAVPLSGTALTGHTLTWYNNFPLTGGSPTTPTPSTATAGTFTYYVTQTPTTNGCASDTSIITVTVTPAIGNNTISSTQTVCSGLPAAPLTGTGVTGGTNNYAYQWQQSTDGGATWTNITGGTLPGYDPATLPTGIFHFRRVVTSGLCSSTSNVAIITVETNLSNYDIAANQIVCEGATPALLNGQSPTGGTGVYTYVWQSSPNGITWTNIAGATGINYQPPVLTATTSYRRITSGGNCPATSNTVLITVNPTPNAAITAPTGICSYDSANVSFTASVGTAPFTIQLVVTAPGGGTSTITQTVNSNGPVSINVIPTGSAAGTYTVQLANITDSRNCSRTTGMPPVNIVVTAKPIVTVAASSNPICEGTPTSLMAAGSNTYLWSPSTGLSATIGITVNANPIITTVYQVIGTTNGCLDTADITVTVIPRPAKPVVVRPVEYCVNATATPLSATATAGNTLTWYNNPNLAGGTTTAPTPSTVTAGTVSYYVTQTNSNNCVSDTSIITVTVHPLPTVNFRLPAGVCMPNGTATFTNNTTIADNSTLSYVWNFGDNSATVTTKDASHIYAASGSYDVILTATSPFGCTSADTLTFSAFFDKPVARFDVNPTTLCQGQENFLTDRSNPSGSTINKWQWLFGDGKTEVVRNPTHRYTQPGNYKVQLIVTTTIGCVSDTFDQDVTVYLQPRIDAGQSFVVPEGTLIQFKATANDTSSVNLLWTPPFGLSNPNTLRPTLTVTQNQTYTLTAIGAGNCTAIDTMTVRILKQIEVPNVFSPNNDGTNDRWVIPNLADYPGAKVEVFNRWGQQVFLSYGYNKPWDGNYLGKPLPLATYYYIITLNNGFKPVTGAVTILK